MHFKDLLEMFHFLIVWNLYDFLNYITTDMTHFFIVYDGIKNIF